MPESPRLLIVGNPAPFHVGAHFMRAAQALGVPTILRDVQHANSTSLWLRRLYWRLGGHRPVFLGAFSRSVVEACRQFRPTHLLTVGLAPVDVKALTIIGTLGIQRVNYLTDDPWNSHHYAKWFMQALPLYDTVYSPRRANLADLETAGCRTVAYLPFAYDPTLHRKPTEHECSKASINEVVFVGGADEDRIPLIKPLTQLGLPLQLYGGYWDRYPQTRAYMRGHATPEELRCITYQAGVNICLVRRANRDGHVMRSFEIAACGGIMVAEDTDEHRAIFGQPGLNVRYFTTSESLTQEVQWLLSHPVEARQLGDNVHKCITTDHHRYQDRLSVILQ